MASDEAKLIVKFEAENKKLHQELERTTKRLSKFEKSAKKSVEGVSSSFKKALGAVAVGAITRSFVRGIAGLSASAREIKNLSGIANTAVDDFQRMAYGANVFGIGQEKLADILKDVNDKVGDFLTTGGGPLKDFFENVAPLIGVTAEQFRGLSGKDALQLYVSSLEKANLSQAEMTFYMEALASDATALLPLLTDNGKKLGELADEADRVGVAMSDIEVRQLEDARRDFDRLDATIAKMTRDVQLDALPAVRELTGVLQDPETVEGVKNIASAVVGLTSRFVELVSASAVWAKNFGLNFREVIKGAHDAEGAIRDLARLRDLGANLDNPKMSARFSRNEEMLDFFIGAADVDRVKLYLSQIEKEISVTLNRIGQDQKAGKSGEQFEPYLQALVAARSNAEAALQAKEKLLSSDVVKLEKDPETKPPVNIPYSKDLQADFDRTLENLQKQAELYGKVGEAAKLRYELEQGALKGLNEADKNKLLSLAAEADDNARLDDFNKALSDVVGPQEEFNKKLADADMLLAAGRISQENYNAVVREYNNALAESTPGIQSAKELHEALLDTMSSEERQVQALEVRIGELTAAMGEFPDKSTEIATAIQGMRAEQAKLIEDMKKQNDELSVFAEEAARNIQDSLGNTLYKSLKGDFDGILDLWLDTLFRMGSEAMAADLASAFNLEGLLKGGSGGSGGGDLLASIGGFFGGFFADGGFPDPGKISVVGEAGPELFVPNGVRGEIVPNHELSGGKSVSVGNMVFPGVRTEKEAKMAAGAAARELAKVIDGSRRY